MMTSCPWPVDHLLPHAAPMLLLDGVIGFDDETVTAAAGIRADHPFADGKGVPAHVGIELMAQACGAWAGAHALAHGEKVRVGFLLGTRRYKAVLSHFPVGMRLEVSARVVFRDQGMGVFDCRISAGDDILAEAQLSLFQPDEGQDGLVDMKGA